MDENEMIFVVDEIQLPELKSNFEKFKSELILAVSQFKIEVTEDNIQEAKKMMTSLNKIKANISEKGKETIAIFKKPVDSFREQIKELEFICDSSRADISVQVQKFEDATKAECEKLLNELVNNLRSDFKIQSNFYETKIDDLILLGSITQKGGLTKKVKETVLYRIQAEQAKQNLYFKHLKEAENECLKAQIEPFSENAIMHILQYDDAKFQNELTRLIDSELERNKKIKAKADAEAKEKVEAEFAEKERCRLANEAQEKRRQEEKELREKEIQRRQDLPPKIDDKPIPTARTNSIIMSEPEIKINNAINESLQKKEVKIRPSSLPRIFVCPNSRHAPEISIEEKFDGNIEGVALHKFSEKYFTIENTDIKAIIGEVEDTYKVDVAYLCWNLAKMLLKYRSVLKNIEAEKKLSAQTKAGFLSGTMDLVGWVDETKAVIIDVKAGFGLNDYTAQLKGYTLLMFKNFPMLEKVAIVTAYANTSKIKSEMFTRADSEQFENELADIYAGKKNGYNVGDNCTYCPLRYECTAKQGVLNGTIQSLLEESNGVINVEMFEKVSLIEKAVKKFKELFRQRVEAEGEVRVGINTYYIAKTVKDKLVLTPESFEYLHSIFGAEMTKFLSISETELKELKMSEVPKGLKIAEWRAFFDELNKKGFTERVVSERISKK